MALYIPHSIFHFGAAFVCQAGNFWTLLRTKLHCFTSSKDFCLYNDFDENFISDRVHF